MRTVFQVKQVTHITLAGNLGKKLERVGYVVVRDGLIISSDPWHTKGDSNPGSTTGVPTFSLMGELASFTVSNKLRKSKSRIVREIKGILGDFPDSRVLKVRVRESRVVQVPRVMSERRAMLKSRVRKFKRDLAREYKLYNEEFCRAKNMGEMNNARISHEERQYSLESQMRDWQNENQSWVGTKWIQTKHGEVPILARRPALYR